jgi:hypothetical protein
MSTREGVLRKWGFAVLVVAALCFAFAQPAHATSKVWGYGVVVPDQTPDFNPDDLHIDFSGAEGTIDYIMVEVNGSSSGTATTDGDSISVGWTLPLSEGDVVWVRFSTQTSEITLDDAYWTIAAAYADTSAGSVGPIAPAASPWGLAVLVAGLLCLAAFVLFRWRRAAA